MYRTLFGFSSRAAAVLAAATFALSFSLSAQPAATHPAETSGPATAKVLYDGEAGVIEHADSIYTYASDGTFIYERTVAVRVQSEAMVRTLGVIGIPYASGTQQVQFLYARVRHADGSVVESSPSDALEMPAPVTREAPFYSDLKEKQLPIRGLRSGDTLEWKTRVTATKPEAPGNFWGVEAFTDDAVVLSQTVELRVPEGVHLTVWSPKHKPEVSTAAASGSTPAMQIYHWDWSQLKPTTGKEAEAEAEAKKKLPWTPEQELDADQGKLPDIAWTTFRSWEEVGAWYRSLEADRTSVTPEIKAKVAELTTGKTADEEKVRAIYAYVSSQVRYIGVDFGIGRYQPHTAAEIFANQYGDCKDKHTLLSAMLSVAGIQSDAVLIGAGVRFNPDVPSPAAFNHLITHLTLPAANNATAQLVWLDATEEVAPYRMLASVLRDHEALIVPQTGDAHVERTPADPPFASFQTMEAKGSLDANGVSHSRIAFTFRGDNELGVREAFHQLSPAQYDLAVQGFSKGIGYEGTTSNAMVSRPEDTTDPFRMSYDYEREKGGDWADLKIVPQLAPVELPRPANDDPLVHSIDLGTPQVYSSSAEMKLPEGWTAILPEAAHYKCDYAVYDQIYRLDKGVLYTERRVEVLKPKVPQEGLKAYKKFTDQADFGSDFYIQLVRHQSPAAAAQKKPEGKDDASTATAASSLPAPAADAASSDPAADAAKLITEAYNDIGKNDLKSAQPLLDRAQALSPDHEYYWNTLGWLEWHRGQMELGLADDKKELELHPNATKRMSPVIADRQIELGRTKDAIETLKQWSNDDPENPDPVERLLNMLLEDDPKQAVTIGEAALPHLPAGKESETVRVTLGSAYVKTDEKQKGTAMLESVLTHTDDAGMLNDAAYTLADAGLDLPLAESSTRAALDKLDAESNAWTLDEDPATLFNKTNLIVATWDTLGWVLYHEGKLEEAQNYIEAAWHGHRDVEVSEHLATIQAARGEKSAALATYQLAIGMFPTTNNMGVRIPPTEKQKQLEQKADELRKAGAKAKAEDPAMALQKDRTIPLGPAAGRNGTAQYRILLRTGKVVKAEPVGDKTIPGAEELLTKAEVSRLFPSGADASLVTMGFVNCHSNICELVLGN